MAQMHSFSKEQREAVRSLLHLVLIRDMGTFTPPRFKDWIKEMDAKFRKVALTLNCRLNNRAVYFTVKELRSKRTAFQFEASTHVAFDDNEFVMDVTEILKNQF
jgi:hypothetical protein